MSFQQAHLDHNLNTPHRWCLSIFTGIALILFFATFMTIAALPLKTTGMALAFHISGDSNKAISSLIASDARYVSGTRVQGLIAIFVPSANALEILRKSGFIFVAKAEAGCLQWTKNIAQVHMQNQLVKRT